MLPIWEMKTILSVPRAKIKSWHGLTDSRVQRYHQGMEM